MALLNLHALLLVGFVSYGSAQLEFNKTGNVTKTACDESVRLPCFVTNLKVRNKTAMLVEWKFNDKSFYSFDGSANNITINPNFSSAALNVQELPQGDISLTISDVDQAAEGKYTCDVTEVSRSGVSILSLTYSHVQVLQPKESVVLVVSLCLAVLVFWIHFGITFSSFYKFRPSETAVKVIAVAGIIITILVVVGLLLLFTKDYSPSSLAGLGIAVIPTMGLILVLQHFLSPSDKLRLFFLAFKMLGFVIAVVGCGFCFATCPPTQAVLVAIGSAIFTAFMFVDLVYAVLQEKPSEPTGPY